MQSATTTTSTSSLSNPTTSIRTLDEPQTPSSWSAPPSRPSFHAERRKSSSSVKRKPVPALDVADDPFTDDASIIVPPRSLEVSNDASPSPNYNDASPLPASSAASSSADLSNAASSPQAPPQYVLPIITHTPTTAADPFSTAPAVIPLTPSTTHEDLPRYTPDTQTEPKTLARGLWRWGWLCPLFWAVGMCILWIPLKPIEEEQDAEKAQKLEEMIVILRQTELKYARWCLWGFLGFLAIIAVAVVVGVVISRFT